MHTKHTVKPDDSLFRDLYVKYRSDKSFHGYASSVLKSGIQKYARRSEVEKGLWCLVELDLFSQLEWDGAALDGYLLKYPDKARKKVQTRAKIIRTNMVNRLIVMMSEEINISTWWMPLKIFELYQQWVDNRANAFSRKCLVDMYLYLASQKMIRLISDLKSVYLLPPLYLEDEKRDDLIKIHNNIKALFPEIYSDQAEIGDVKWGVKTDKSPKELLPCMKGIIYNLETGSDNIFYWIKKLCNIERDGWSPKEKKDKEDKFVFKYIYFGMIWDILHRFIDRNSRYEFLRATIEALHFFHVKMGHKEKPIYLYHAILLLIRRDEIDWDAEAPFIDTQVADVDRMYRDHIAGGRIPMDDYILDLHTHGGKHSSNCLENFALEGAYIENENTNFLRQDYRNIYLILKQELDGYHSRGGLLL